MPTIIYQENNFIRSLFVEYNNTAYVINKIIFFKSGKEIITLNRGFFDKDYESLKISDKDIVRKIKPDLNLKQPFIMTHIEKWRAATTQEAILYVYVDDIYIKLSAIRTNLELTLCAQPICYPPIILLY